ncbi:MG2 domain-containing protein [Flavobacteriaceae bacterium S0825]|uniref:alpha-2-macroglobulin family protein n=1 Tax=Gaetbulibacter sp. S0825 TaxID=2720084 RepID=UPI001431C235|nr:MG2 domain-containing protein [Gaetbulibacter sp. S0825]MCK0108757.1 MG2 domain-containing protein [Flavobacteriaceae bacterium S0825]NIX64393.1 alpha-2-macroglobulin [Gaetbulibacter sp. S0825]
MNKTITIIMILLFANLSHSQNNYSDLWKSVEKLEVDGLPKSALEVVEVISAKAEKNDNNVQRIKALLFKSKFALILEEDAKLNIINDFKTQISKSEFPTKNILESLLANLYWHYFQQNRWQFYNRTKTSEKVDKDDFRTWDLQTIFDEISLHYQNSLKQQLLLKLEDLKNFDELLILQKDSKTYRPTLFDFLANNALEFYTTDENSITKPAYKFEIDNEQFLNDAKSFSQLAIVSKDSTSLQLQTLKLYQDLIQFHVKDKSHYALADVDIKRLLYVKQHATFSDIDTKLLETLKAESNRLKSHEVSALYDFEIASIYGRQGDTYQPTTNETHRWKLKEAIEICNAVINKFPKSKGAEKCQILKQQILKKSLQITAESHLSIDKNSRLLIRYKNFDHLNFKVFHVSRNQLEKLNKIYRKEEQLAFINKLKVTKQWQSNLRDEHDYQTHSTEVVLPELNNGYYVVFASPDSDKESMFAFAPVQITNLAIVDKSDANHHIYQVINRNNGAPIANAKVTLNFRRGNSTEQTEHKTTNTNGDIKIRKTKGRYWQLDIIVSTKNDKAYFDNFYVNNRENFSEEEAEFRAFLFTDRSIYRPGQTVYFKGIAMKTEDGKSEVLEKEAVTATLFDVNNEIISQHKLTTNNFGSVSGEFILPNNGLNGQFRIELYSVEKNRFRTNSYISVEEYKRPKFETTFNPVTETYKINDSVTVKGNALAYAGSNITDAKVVYRVHRKVQYPRWYFWHRPWFNSEPQEITHGETITNEKGEFEITFKAQPDESVDKSSLPIFNYEIIADVTDLNGETRSATTIVNVGYHALTANISVDAKLDKTQKEHKLTIDTKNLNGEFAPAKGSIKIYKLIAPKSVLRQRPWKAPDYQMLSESEFKKLFPNDAYTNEHDSNQWEKGTLVLEKSFNTETSKEFALGKIKKWESGQYIIVLITKDKFGQDVKDQIKTILYSDKDKQVSDNQLFAVTTDKSKYNIGDTAEITFASAANLTVTVDIEKDHNIIKTEVIHLNNNKETICIPVDKKDLGGFVVHYSFAAFNSFENGVVNISVPYPKTDLEIETLTFRDKLQPGTDETWSFKIKGPKGDKVAAELLASMYDASLDQFKPHNWNFNPIQNPTYYSNSRRNARQGFGTVNFRIQRDIPVYYQFNAQQYDQINWFGFYIGGKNIRFFRENAYANISPSRKVSSGVTNMMISDSEEIVLTEVEATEEDVDVLLAYNSEGYKRKEKSKFNTDGIQIRKNLQETTFFFPHLQTDAEGNVTFSFTTPEALTKWKLQLLAHTKTLESAVTSLETLTQKELMVIPNAPRFLREGDQITISSKIANLTDKTLSGAARLELTDAITGKSLTVELLGKTGINYTIPMKLTDKEFKVDAKGNTQVSWSLNIPETVQAVQYKVIAKTNDFSDGEQNALPVLSNRMLVTETLPMWIRSNETRTFTLDKLKTNTSTTLKHHKLTLEMTSNPAWYAVQALPYLMEYPYECNEQTFSRYYANALASHIANSNPRIQEVFNQWRNADALISNLEKNEELKSILIQETPWLRDAQSETEQKKRIALLFDMNKMSNELQSALHKLENSQMTSGGWAWFNGGRENRYITQHIITGFGHLKQLGVTLSPSTALRTGSVETSMIQKAIRYLDSEFIKEYKNITKYNKDVDLSKDHLSYTQLHYLYMRSFFKDIEKSKEVEDITAYYHSQIKKYWLSRSLYAKGLMALVVDRMDDNTTSAKILKSLKENSITSDELGMYWKENTNSWYWYQAPIETQALLIEAFSEIENDTETIDNLKIWLLKNKQTNQWKTTKATTEAVYALLLQGSDWLSVTDMVDVVLGGKEISPSKLENVKVEAGTGYYKTSWNGSEIQPEMADVKLTKKGKGIAWGSLYWQYFEDLDKITSAETPLKLNKKLFLKTNTDKGEEITEITSETKLQVGDLVRVRIELRSDRTMEFIHMKDMRASGLEPINVLSQYKWQDGLGYYQSTKDASTNFFFDYLPKGVYVFEYDLRVNNAGNMSNGITTIQSMYAPEFSSHSEGVRVNVN